MEARCDSSMVLNSFDNQLVSPVNSRKDVRDVDEMDFFAGKKKGLKNASRSMNIKRERSYDDGESPQELHLNLNTGLNLFTANTTASDKSTVDDHSASPETDHKRTLNELAVLHKELDRMNKENERLRAMLHQVNERYVALQRHIVTIMQRQENQNDETTGDINNSKMIEGLQEDRKEGISLPRQFMDPGQAADDHLLRTMNENLPAANIQRKDDSRETRGNDISLEKDVGEWSNLDKESKLSSPKEVEQQAEATMKRARVSVRARSESSMISDAHKIEIMSRIETVELWNLHVLLMEIERCRSTKGRES